MTTTPPATHVATLVAQDAVDKREALYAIARATGSRVVGMGTPHPTVALADGVWVEIDIPKFGEPPPLAIDVHAVESRDVARRHALALLETLTQATSWSVVTDFDRVH